MENQETLVHKGDDHELINLLPGFRFHPTDDEIITHYLTEKVMDSNFTCYAIVEVDLNKCEPWDLPKKAKNMGEKDLYFFYQRDRKYPTGMRTNRATSYGYWKATGKDKEIYKGKDCLVGMKKTLVFYKGRAPKGEKTNWVMHEYRLEGKFSYYNLPSCARDEWVVCRVFHKISGMKKSSIHELLNHDFRADCSSSLPRLVDPTQSDPSDIATTSRSLEGSYFSEFSTNMVNMIINNIQNNTIPSTSYLYPQILPNKSPTFTFQDPPNMGFLTEERTTSNTIPSSPTHCGDEQDLLRALANNGNNNICDHGQEIKTSNLELKEEDIDIIESHDKVMYEDEDFVEQDQGEAIRYLENMWDD